MGGWLREFDDISPPKVGGAEVGRVAVDKSEGVVKAQTFPAVFFHRVIVRVVEGRSFETLTVNQLSADRSANHTA